MVLTWRQRRKVLYYGAGFFVVLVSLAILWLVVFSRTPSCSDGIQNQGEEGVDCGKPCARLCPAETREPTVLWRLPFRTSQGTYTAVAYVRNNNVGVGGGARDVRYSFRLFDERGVLVVERLGISDIPPVALVPIVETGIEVGERTVARAEFAFVDEEIRWERTAREFPAVRISNPTLAPDGSRLSATIVNDSIIEARDFTLVAVLFDIAGVARAASKTVISRLPRQGSQTVVFTWPSGVPDVLTYDITVLPPF